MRSIRLLALSCLAAAPVLRAQAPVITPNGDPSVQNDTIYRLAVNPADHPEESWVYLLDDGVIRAEADGRYTATYRQVVQITREAGVNEWQERSFSYAPGHEKFRINWIRVVKPDGEVISAKPSELQESDVPAEMGDPVYSDVHEIRASLSGVKVGVLVDYSITETEDKPYRPGDFFEEWTVTTGLTTRRSRYLVDVPDSMPLSIVEQNLDFKRKEWVANGRHMYLWAAQDVPRVRPEAFAADSNGVIMSVSIASKGTWAGVGAWFAGLAHDRFTLSPTAAAKVRALVAHATTREDSIRAVHRWVAQDIRYVSIDFGIGGYRPRTADSVIATGFGDCKDKTMLFVAAMHTLGITAYPVLLSAGGDVERQLPSKDQFDHAIAAVKGPDGYTYTDLTVDLMPYGELPSVDQGEFGLIVHPDGQTEEVTLPETPPSANFVADSLVGTLSTGGVFQGVFSELAGGTRAVQLRSAFRTTFDSTQRANAMRALATDLFSGADGDSLVAFSGKDLSAVPRMQIDVTDSSALQHSGDMELFTLPYSPMGSMVNLANALSAEPARRFPIDASDIIGPLVTTKVLRMTLPAGWTAQVPRSVEASSPFGSYSAQYVQSGRTFIMTRTLTGTRGIFPPDRISDLINWVREVGADDAQFILIRHDSTGPASSR